MNTADSIQQAKQWTDKTAKLKAQSPLFPDMLLLEEEDIMYASTIVKFSYDGKNYLRHHLESATKTKTVGMQQVHNKIVEAVKMTQEFGKPFLFDEVTD